MLPACQSLGKQSNPFTYHIKQNLFRPYTDIPYQAFLPARAGQPTLPVLQFNLPHLALTDSTTTSSIFSRPSTLRRHIVSITKCRPISPPLHQHPSPLTHIRNRLPRNIPASRCIQSRRQRTAKPDMVTYHNHYPRVGHRVIHPTSRHKTPTSMGT